MNYLILDSLSKFSDYYGSDYEVEFPTNSGDMMNIKDAARGVSERLLAMFLPGKDGRIPMYGDYKKFQDPHFKDSHLFFEYFDGDTGKGLGANHQTGWTGLISEIIRQLHGKN
jgi:hypothetical protein